ncbi:MAG: SLBB domain-containing protein [Verrucomicrobia bacterium]|nr:SLBB domain-containing protein [Verrucomicrobiota bacterium]
MKIHKIALSFALWICLGSSTIWAQTELIPPLPADKMTPAQIHAQPLAQATPSPTPSQAYIDILNDTVKLDKGDRLSYRIAEERVPAITLVVNDAGDLDVPLIGHITATGKTCKKLASEIKPLLEKEFYYKATVILGLETHSERSIGKVYIMGLARLPGGMDIPAGETLTLSKAIARAQGFADFADKENVRLFRRGAQGKIEMTIVNVGEIIDKGLLDKDPAVLPNDTIIIPEVKRFHSKVYVLGRVSVAGGMDLQENEQLTVSKAITRAQGFAEYADKEKVKLLRKNVTIPWFVVEDFLNPFALSNKIGANPDPLSQLLKSRFAPESLAVLTNPKSTPQQQKFVLIEELNKAIQGELLYDDQRFAAITLSVLEDAYPRELRRNRLPEYQVFIVNVAEILDKGLLDKDPTLEPNDLVVVPESKRTNSKVSVMGQVHYPQTMEMLSGGNLSVSQVIAHAGGFSEFANKRKVKLLRKNPAETYLLVPGDILKLRSLVNKLREHKDALSLFVWEHLTYPSRQILTDPRANADQQRMAIVKEFNRIFKEGSSYTEARFASVKLPPEIALAVAAQSNTCLFTTDDFLDLSGFVLKLKSHNDPLFLFLWNQFNEQERKTLENAAAATRQQEAGLMEVLLTKLNTILRSGSIYTPQSFEKVEISPESLALLTLNPEGDELVRLNRLLLEDACPQEIKKAPYNPQDKAVVRLNRRLFEVAYPHEILRHDEYQTIMVDMQRIIDKAELDKDPLIEPDDLIMVPERWINF